MSDNIERFNAKYAGSYLGDEWVVRASDFEAAQSELTAARDEIETLKSGQVKTDNSQTLVNALAEIERLRGRVSELERWASRRPNVHDRDLRIEYARWADELEAGGGE